MPAVRLTVRTPSLSDGQDVELVCELDWSVLRVKEEIQAVFAPHHPKPEDQRLVYAGKLLQNYDPLSGVLRLDDEQVRTHAQTL